jgi:hypothetical protein
MHVSGCSQFTAYIPEAPMECRGSVENVHADVVHGRDAKQRSRRQFKGKEDVVVVTDDPPELCLSQIPVGQKIQPVTVGNGMKAVIESRGCIDRKAHAKGITVTVSIPETFCVSGILVDHERTSDQLTD